MRRAAKKKKGVLGGALADEARAKSLKKRKEKEEEVGTGRSRGVLDTRVKKVKRPPEH